MDKGQEKQPWLMKDEALAYPDIRYADGIVFTAEQMAGLFGRSNPEGAEPDRPSDVEAMFALANLVATAWTGAELVGVARAFSDFRFVAYLADLVVDRAWRRRGVGRGLVERLMARLALGAKMVLLSSPEAEGFYRRLGFTGRPGGWTKVRE